MTGSADGGHPAPLPKWDPEGFLPENADGPDQQVKDPNVAETGDNIVQRIDVTSIANDEPNDSDYDDPYPGGDTPSLGVPSDG